MRILYDNKLNSAGTFTATNENSSYPIEEVLDGRLSTIFKSTTSTSTITKTLSASAVISAVAWGGTNATQVIVSGYDGASNLLWTDTLTGTDAKFSSDFPGNIHYTGYTGQTTVITFAITGASPLEIGELYAGSYLQCPYFDSGATLGYTTTSGVQKSRYGQAYDTPGESLRTLSVNFSAISQTDRLLLNDFFIVAKRNRRVWVDGWESEFEYFPPLFGTMENEPSYTKSGSEYFDGLKLDFEECK